MWEITADHAAEYLRATGRVAHDDRVDVRELTGGVSNVVLYVQNRAAKPADAAARELAFVVKQARPRLRVAQPWFCSIERNWRELAVLRVCQTILARAPTGNRTEPLVAVTPAVLWEDRDNYAFAMSAAPADHVVWKQCLLDPAGNAAFAQSNPRIAAACGRLLGRLHAATWNDESLREALGDTSLFDALRVDPYYRRIAAVHADLRLRIDGLIASLAENPRALVHADFSPKNLLVWRDGGGGGDDGGGGAIALMMVDFETGHFGDPAFDLGFFLTHLALKAIHHAPRHEPLLALADDFWNAYLETLRDGGLANGAASEVAGEIPALAARAMRHLGGCTLARIDGKSPVDYLESAAARDTARAFGRTLLVDPAESWPAARRRLTEQLAAR